MTCRDCGYAPCQSCAGAWSQVEDRALFGIQLMMLALTLSNTIALFWQLMGGSK